MINTGPQRWEHPESDHCLAPAAPPPYLPPPSAAKDGSPVGIVQTSADELEAQEALTAPGVPEGVSTIPDNKA